MKKLLSLLVILGFAVHSYASHIPGGNITYQCTGNPNEYIITMQLMVSCPSSLGTQYTLTASNTCGLPNPAIVLPQLGTAQEVSQICPAQQNLSDCPPGTGGIPGVMLYTYQATITLPAGCNTWTFAFELCCRDGSTNTNGGTGNSMYFETTMNSVTAPCDNSPYVTAQPIPYVCAGQQITYCPGAVDPDGDSLYYELVNPMGAGAVAITHPAPYSPTNPLQNSVFDPNTGCITFNQPTIGNFVITYKITAYDANGNETGSIIHDFQFEVITCTNITPQPPAGGIALVSGNATQTGPNTIELCEGSTACFSMTFTDVDPLDVLTIDTLNSNIFTVFPGATITTTGTNPMTIDICWTVPAGSPTQIIATVTVTDGACPIEGTATQIAIFDVITSTVANPDITICGNQTAQLTASGGSVFNWTVASGPAINVPANFSCNPCANPVASPTATTTYIVTSNLSGGCDNVDTTTVTVVPDFTYTLTQSSPSACLFDPIQLNATVNPAAPGYSYLWYPNTFLDFDTIPNPLANITVPGTHVIYVDITSPGGCVKTDSITVTVTPFVAPDIDILTPDSLMPCGDSILVQLDLGGGIPALCGPSPTNTCSGPTTQTTVGTGTTSISNPPSPYYGFYEDGRVQMIYTAAELNALGFMGGKITELAFNVLSVFSTQPYSGFTIRMGCTALADFTTQADFVPGLFQVYTNASVTPTVGWNNYVLNTAYEWDGISNLIVEVCFDNASWTSSDDVAQTATAAPMTLYAYDDGNVGCTLNNTLWSFSNSFNRPNIRLTQCPTVPDPNAFDFLWTPNTTIITSTSQNPVVYPSQPTSYVVTVSDTGGNCFDTDTININVLCGSCYPPIPTVTNVTCKDGSDGMIVINPVFVFGSEVQSFQWKDSITGTILQNTNNLTAGMQDSLTGLPAGAYTITMTDSSGCSADTTIWITEPDSVLINSITADDIVCIGGSKQIDATATGGNGGPYTYSWVDLSTTTPIPGNGPHTVFPIVSPTCYQVTATDPLGCESDTQQVCISLYPSLIASTTDDSITVCPGASTNIDMSAIGGSGVGYNYDWYENGNLIGNGGVFNVTPTSSPTTYIGVVTDNCTTPADSVMIYVDWFNLPTPDFTRNKPDSCYPITIELTNTSTPAALVGSSTWSISDGSTLNGNPVNHTFGTPTCHDVRLTVTTVDGCVVDTLKTNFVCPHPYPDANFYMTPPITDVLNTEIDFTNLSSGLGLTYLWNFGSGLNPDSSTLMNPKFTYPDDTPGMYPVTLTVTNQYGCVDTANGTVIVNGIYLFYVPNSFTPDGDGVNEIFRPYGEGIDFSQYTMQIFNRWGELIYETNEPELGWDGTYKGSPVQVGTYIWKIVAKEEYTPIIHDNFGHVNLIR